MKRYLRSFGLFILVFVIHVVTANAGTSGVITYPAPPGLQTSPDLKVHANGIPVWVERAGSKLEKFDHEVGLYGGRKLDDMDVAAFAFTGKINLVISANQKIEKLIIRPKSLNINAEIKDNQLNINLDSPVKLYIEINNLPHLAIFADAPESNPIMKSTKGITYFGPGEHKPGKIKLSGNQTIYVAAGAIVYADITGKDLKNVTIRGRGMLQGTIKISGTSDLHVSELLLVTPGVSSQTGTEIQFLVRGDDIGSSHTANIACIESYRNGIMKSVELMVPGPWFPEAVKMLQENPGLDVGVHLVVTSEWSHIKWRPLTCCPSLVDQDGYFFPMIWPNPNFPKGSSLKEAKWKIDEIEKEFRAQIETARKHIPWISHVNCHMGCEGCDPQIADLVTKLAKEYRLNIDPEKAGFKYLSLWGEMDTTAEQRITATVKTLNTLYPGKYYFIEHPGYNSTEMQAIWHKGYENVASDRDAVTKVYTSPEIKEVIKDKGISLVSYKDIGLKEVTGDTKQGNKPKVLRQKDYSMYRDIYDLVASEFNILKVNGTSIINSRTNSINLSGEVLLVVNDMITPDVSFVNPIDVLNVEFLDDYRASTYGMRGANGVLKITLKK